MADVSLALGIIGVALLLVAFVLNAAKKKHLRPKFYLALNLLGASLLAYYAFAIQSIPFLIIESVWAVFSLYELQLLLKRR